MQNIYTKKFLYYFHSTIAILPGLTKEGHRVFLMKITNPDPNSYDLETVMKRCLMMMDTYLKEGVDFTGMHIIHDLEHFRLGHLTKFNLTLMKVMTLGMVSNAKR